MNLEPGEESELACEEDAVLPGLVSFLPLIYRLPPPHFRLALFLLRTLLPSVCVCSTSEICGWCTAIILPFPSPLHPPPK